MKNLKLLMLFILLYSCNKPRIPLSKSYHGVDGLLYFELPETGSTITGVFFPYSSQKIDTTLLKPKDYKLGMKFEIFNPNIQDKLYRSGAQEAILKDTRHRRAYLLTKVRLYYHINEKMFPENSSIIGGLRSDTLIYRGNVNVLKHYFNIIELDSIKIR